MVNPCVSQVSEDCIQKLKVLADQTRMSVLQLLLKSPLCVADLQTQLQVEISLLSHHLKILRDAGLVETERQGKSVQYSISPTVTINAPVNGISLGCCVLSFGQCC